MATTGTFDLIAALDRRGLLPREVLEEAVAEAHLQGTTLHQILVAGGLIPEAELDFVLSEELGIPQIHPSPEIIDVGLVGEFPSEVLRRRTMVPVFLEEGEVTVALADPLDREAVRDLERVSPYRVRPAVAESGRIVQILDAILGPEDREGDEWSVTALRIMADAFTQGSTEVHVEPIRAGTRIRRRLGGRLEEHELHPPESLEPLLERLRVLARMPSGEPGKGRFRVNLGGVGVDVDLAILPTPQGDSAVLLFGKSWRFPSELDGWRIEDRVLESIRDALERPGGLIIVNSPRGDCRRALAYALLGETDAAHGKVLTFESSAFRKVSGWTQVEEGDLPVPDSRRSLELLLAQRPDALLLEGPSDWALPMALPHVLEGMRLVLDMPYVDAADVLLHLQSMQLPPPLLDRTLRLVLSVAEVPGLCPSCRRPAEEDEDGDPGYAALGCAACGGTGFHDTVLVPGHFAPSPGTVRRLLRESDGSSLLTLIGRAGHITIRRNARRYVRTGRISPLDARELL